MTKETLQQWIESYKGDNFAYDLTSLIEKEERLIRERTFINCKRETLNKKIAKEQQEILQLERISQKSCDHFETSFYPDASGNNDSYRQCDLCGKIL